MGVILKALDNCIVKMSQLLMTGCIGANNDISVYTGTRRCIFYIYTHTHTSLCSRQKESGKEHANFVFLGF